MNSSFINKVPLLKHIKLNLSSLRDIIIGRIVKKLESIELTAEVRNFT